jgi:hypothetical protein
MHFEGGRWHLTLRINPKLDVFFPGEEGAEIRQSLEAANRTVKSLEAKLTGLYDELLGDQRRTAQRREEARQGVRDRVGGVAGLTAGMATDPDLVERQQAAGAGDAFQGQAEAHVRQEATAAGRIFVGPRTDSRSGLDAVEIDVDAEEVTAHEFKRGDLRTLVPEASSRGTSVPEDRQITVDAPEGRGSLAARHLQEHPDDAAALADDHILVQERSNFENKLSAIVNELESNLETVEQQLATAMREAEAEDQPRYQRAIELVQAIRTNQGGSLRRIISVRGSVVETERQAAMQLLQASAERLDNVNIEDLIRRLDDDGKPIVVE